MIKSSSVLISKFTEERAFNHLHIFLQTEYSKNLDLLQREELKNFPPQEIELKA